MMSASEKFVVLADPHGNASLFEAVCHTYGDDVRYIVAGDAVDGPNVRGLLNRIVSVDGLLVRGNHEQYLLGSMLESEDEENGDEQRRDIVSIWGSIHNGTLESYGLYGGPTPANALRLRDKMEELGHLALLSESPLYYETEDFVVLHADVTQQPWEVQKAALDNEYDRNKAGKYWGWSNDYLMPQQLGEQQVSIHTINFVRSGLAKRLLSGHFHLDTRDTNIRSYNAGQHLLLAGGHNRGFAVVYESWTEAMRVVEAD